VSPPIRQALVAVGLLLFVAGVLVGAVRLWGTLYTAPTPRSGFTVIRPPHEVSALALQGQVLWAGGRDGVVGLDRESGAVVQVLEPETPLRYVRALAIDGDGALWIGHVGGLTRWDGSTFRTWTAADGLPDDRVNALLVDGEGTLWVGTWGGAAALREGAFEVLAQAGGLAADMVNVLFQDDRGGMWFGSAVAPRGGLAIRTDGTWQRFTPAEGLPHPNVSSIAQGRDGAVWVGTGLLDRGGAARFTRTPTGWVLDRVRTREDGLAGEKVRSIYQDSRGAWWLGSEYDGVLWENGDASLVLTDYDGLSSPEVKVFLEDPEGILWLGTRDGVTRIDLAAMVSEVAP
jgi:ligand-binding sensor domain-containing protein